MILTALKPTVGKTICSLLLACIAAAYVGMTYFIGGMVIGTVEAGVQTPGVVLTGDVTSLEDAAKRPVELAVSHAVPTFVKWLAWTYGLWSLFQLFGLLRKKK